MSLRDMADYIRGRKLLFSHYRLVLFAGVAFIIAWSIHQSYSLSLLTISTVASAQVIYVAWSRLTARIRESEELSRLHFATAEALATAIDAKDQTTHCHVRRL